MKKKKLIELTLNFLIKSTEKEKKSGTQTCPAFEFRKSNLKICIKQKKKVKIPILVFNFRHI